MITIHKFPVLPKFQLSLPMGARFLAVQNQLGTTPTGRESGGLGGQCWFQVDLAAESERRYFEVYGTGQPLEEPVLELRYLGTYQEDYNLVWHLYERNAAIMRLRAMALGID